MGRILLLLLLLRGDSVAWMGGCGVLGLESVLATGWLRDQWGDEEWTGLGWNVCANTMGS